MFCINDSEFICDDFPIIASFSIYSLVHSVNQSIYLSYGTYSYYPFIVEGSQLVLSEKNVVSYYSRESTECIVVRCND